jgi:WD repeat-containing protein 7
MSATSAFLVPLTLHGVSEITDSRRTDDQNARDVVETSCSSARCRRLYAWESSTSAPEEGSSGAVLGCEDGSIFVFEQARIAQDANITKSREPSYVSGSRTPSLILRDSNAPSRSISPSAFSPPPFAISSRSKIVAGVTTEQVEAPKNYVDFDEEPMKLKEMLQGKRRSSNHDLRVKPGQATVLDPSPAGVKRKDEPRSLLSATNSPPFSPVSLSTPPSPGGRSGYARATDSFGLLCHTVPPLNGEGHAITDIITLQDMDSMLVLQESGYEHLPAAKILALNTSSVNSQSSKYEMDDVCIPRTLIQHHCNPQMVPLILRAHLTSGHGRIYSSSKRRRYSPVLHSRKSSDNVPPDRTPPRIGHGRHSVTII